MGKIEMTFSLALPSRENRDRSDSLPIKIGRGAGKTALTLERGAVPSRVLGIRRLRELNVIVKNLLCSS
jgi:hypothetical protein